MSLLTMLEEFPDDLREILHDNDVAMDVVRMVVNEPRNQWAFELERILQLSKDHAEDFLREQNECHWCHGSGGGYMGRIDRDSWCPHCRGTGRRAA